MPRILYYTAIGDAIGAGFEFTNQTIDSFDDLKGYKHHPKMKPTNVGTYTDDTQMSIALAETMLLRYTVESIQPVDFANTFLRVFRDDPRDGYARGFQKLLNTFKGDGRDLIETIEKHGKSSRNGAAMRTVVLGYYTALWNVCTSAQSHGSVTHDKQGQYAATMIAHLSHLLKHNSKQRALELMYKEYKCLHDLAVELPMCPVDGIPTAVIAIKLFERNNTLKDLIVDAINTKGDTDSVLAIACGLAAWPNSSYDLSLPRWCDEELENNKFGRDYINGLDLLLTKAFYK